MMRPAFLLALLLLSQSGSSFLRPSRPITTPTLRSSVSLDVSAASPFEALPSFYEWRDEHRIRYTERKQQGDRGGGGGRAAVVLVHGFGASYAQYRDNIPALVSEGYDVFGLDLLGFGGSAKPLPTEDGHVVYSIDTWSDLLSDFLRDIVGEQQPVALVGNSIGSLVCANLAMRSPAAVDALVLLNCAGGMNSKLLLNEPGIPMLLKALVLRPLLSVFDLVLTSPLTRELAQGFFDDFRSRENVEQVLRQVYVNAAARVDEALVSQILSPADDPNAFRVFCAILSGDPGPHPTTIFPKLTSTATPVCFVWGEEDPWTPLSGATAQFLRDWSAESSSSSFVALPDVGHCPHDDDPDAVNAVMQSWLGEWRGSLPAVVVP